MCNRATDILACRQIEIMYFYWNTIFFLQCYFWVTVIFWKLSTSMRNDSESHHSGAPLSGTSAICMKSHFNSLVPVLNSVSNISPKVYLVENLRLISVRISDKVLSTTYTRIHFSSTNVSPIVITEMWFEDAIYVYKQLHVL